MASVQVERLMLPLGLAIDIAQFTALFVLSLANGFIAYSVFKLQKERNTPNLVVYVELVEEDDRDYYGLYIQNVGLVPALNVSISVEIEEWRDGTPVKSKFHERYERFVGHHITLNSQDHKMYELPSMDGSSLIITSVASCSNGPSDNGYFVLGDDPSALWEVMFGKSRKRTLSRLMPWKSLEIQEPRRPLVSMDLDSLKDYEELEGDKTDSS